MNYKAISVDLAKNVFQVCGIDKRIKPVFNQKIRRNQLENFYGATIPYDRVYGGLLFIKLLGQSFPATWT